MLSYHNQPRQFQNYLQFGDLNYYFRKCKFELHPFSCFSPGIYWLYLVFSFKDFLLNCIHFDDKNIHKVKVQHRMEQQTQNASAMSFTILLNYCLEYMNIRLIVVKNEDFSYFFLFGFYSSQRFFHSYQSIVRWSENGRSTRNKRCHRTA